MQCVDCSWKQLLWSGSCGSRARGRKRLGSGFDEGCLDFDLVSRRERKNPGLFPCDRRSHWEWQPVCLRRVVVPGLKGQWFRWFGRPFLEGHLRFGRYSIVWHYGGWYGRIVGLPSPHATFWCGSFPSLAHNVVSTLATLGLGPWASPPWLFIGPIVRAFLHLGEFPVLMIRGWPSDSRDHISHRGIMVPHGKMMYSACMTMIIPECL